jgi:hypothetical protein
MWQVVEAQGVLANGDVMCIKKLVHQFQNILK